METKCSCCSCKFQFFLFSSMRFCLFLFWPPKNRFVSYFSFFLLFHRHLLDVWFCFARLGRQKRRNKKGQLWKKCICGRPNEENMKHMHWEKHQNIVRVGVEDFNCSMFLNAFLLLAIHKDAFSYVFWYLLCLSIASSWICCFDLRGRGARNDKQKGNMEKAYFGRTK